MPKLNPKQLKRYQKRHQAPPMEIDSDDFCTQTGKRHKPDWHSVQVQYDGNQLYVDVNCKDCGRSGCVGTHETLTDNINW